MLQLDLQGHKGEWRMRHLHVSLTNSTVLGVYLGDLDAALTNQIEVLASRCSSRPEGSNRDISDKSVVHSFLLVDDVVPRW